MNTALQPGFMVIHGNHPETLRHLMVDWLARHPLGPLEDECILVQSNGVAQWLRLSLAASPEAGGCGIAAALQTHLPARFLWQAYRAVLGADAVPSTSTFDRSPLVWRLMRLLPTLLDDAPFAPLQHFLAHDDDLRKQHQLCERLADLFDQYQVYRADWLADWAAGQDVIATSREGRQPVPEAERWQPALWRALLADVGPAQAAGGRAEVHRRFLAAARVDAAATRPPGLPRRVVVFGISSLPRQSLEVLAALAPWCQVLLCVHNPSEHDWSEIVADKDLLRAAYRRQRRRGGADATAPEASATPAPGQPLLAAWGKQGRDFIRLLDLHDERASYEGAFTAIGQRVDCFDPLPADRLLRQLQDDVRDLRPLAESRALWPPVDPAVDDSIRFHVAHGAQREVEVLHDELLSAFAADATLQARDVIVMVPDIARYAPHIEAVFGLLPRSDPRHLPFTIADRGQRGHDPWLEALERLLGLPQSRLRTSDVLDLLEVPAVRRRFAIDASDLPRLHRWIADANIRWGLHARQRTQLGLPAADDRNTWDFGLQRMLLGYATGAGDDWQGVAPHADIGGLEAATLGSLAALLETLEQHWRVLSTPAAPGEWGERLRRLMDDFFATDEGADDLTRLKLDTALEDWLADCESAGLLAPLPLSVVREHWLQQVDAGALAQPFFGGGVTFATLMPMRAIPFRWVALLGMDDGEFPRAQVPMDFDLMGADYRPGDRSRREDDRYMFLEALLSAREHLHVSWVGRSIQDQSERPPSVLVAQLRDHLGSGWRREGDERLEPESAAASLLGALTVVHRLQPFHPAYFTQGDDPRLRSHAREWRAGLTSGPAAAPLPATPLALLEPEGPLRLATVIDFLKHPVRAFFRTRLQVYFRSEDPVCEDEEPFAIDGLENWKLQDELVQAQLLAISQGDDDAPALEAGLARLATRGALPAKAFGTLMQEELAEPMANMMSRYRTAALAWPTILPDLPVDHWPDDPRLAGVEALHLLDAVGGLRASPAGDGSRIVISTSKLLTGRAWRLDKLVPAWVVHVAAQLDGPPLTTLLIGKDADATLSPLDPARARALWTDLLIAWRAGLREPLPLAVRTGFAWLAGLMNGEEAALKAARAAYESADPAFARGVERNDCAYLTRAFPSFDALLADGRFPHWAQVLLKPIDDALVRKKKAPNAEEPA